jgi:hypothetical protein
MTFDEWSELFQKTSRGDRVAVTSHQQPLDRSETTVEAHRESILIERADSVSVAAEAAATARLRAANLRAVAERRRTESRLSQPNLGHRAPRVAKDTKMRSTRAEAHSRRTATNFHHSSSPMVNRPHSSRLPVLERGTTPPKPSRIPGSIGETTSNRRYVSAQITSNDKKKAVCLLLVIPIIQSLWTIEHFCGTSCLANWN